MRRAWGGLESQLRYQIIGPFLILTVVVAVLGSAVVFYQMAGSLQERFNNQLASVTRTANDALLSQEQANLQFLREVAFAQRNESTGAPGVADAFAANNIQGLKDALDPFFRVSANRSGVSLDRMIAFDGKGQTISDFERAAGGGSQDYTTHTPIDLSEAWFTQRVLNGANDSRGDKYAGLIQFKATSSETETLYFATIAPVRQGDTVVGGLIAAIRVDGVDGLLSKLKARSQAAGVTLYSQSGAMLASTFSAPKGPSAMNAQLLSTFESSASDLTVFSTETIDDREYQFAYIPFAIRGTSVGILAPALSRDYVVDTGINTLGPIVALVMMLALVLFGVGVWIANRITAPIGELARTAEAITAGDLTRRAQITSQNEIGTLAHSFNMMTGHLTSLYGQVQSESSQRAAIVESIADGIVVCDVQGRITLINEATRRFLGIGDDEPPPTWFSDIPLKELTDGVPGFGTQRAHGLFSLGERIVRAAANPVMTSTGTRFGSVCVLQDMTAEVAVDRAKTNFIGTISHELRTPLTVIRGNSDLLMRGLAGPLDDDQKVFVDSIRQHASNMTSLISNVIVIAGLDSGSLATDLEPIELNRPVDEAAWPLQSLIKAKGLTLKIELPRDLPQVFVDFDQVRMIMHQLLDNARRYTSQGGIVVRATALPEHMLVEVEDTGRGISPDMHEQVFQRFIRGDGASEGINSSERGIGLGLAICKQLVERQGGTIWMKSTPGQGSTFCFTLRYANATPSPENPKALLATAA
ncbi:MAG: ATP-binding protein [Chloroflexales bacterium]